MAARLPLRRPRNRPPQEPGVALVSDQDCNVHCSSPDQRVYVGFLPECPAAARGDLWHINVKETNDATASWRQSFGPGHPG
ncbi:DUF317 domain-containing protein [Streptomyces sp. NPDC059008]|uniref:DUF317 domain-containing protein n=1 Tax=Streptomyces sp. NPDC059008 TaxID=3346693 RepID=UPI00367F871A